MIMSNFNNFVKSSSNDQSNKPNTPSNDKINQDQQKNAENRPQINVPKEDQKITEKK